MSRRGSNNVENYIMINNINQDVLLHLQTVGKYFHLYA